MHFKIDADFNTDCLALGGIDDILNHPLTELVFFYRDFDRVLACVGNMGCNIKLIAGTCGISE